MAFDRDGRLWIGSYGSGVWVVDKDKVQRVASKNGKFPSDKTSKLIADGNRMWAATTDAGLIYFDLEKGDWYPVDPSPGVSMNRLHAFLIGPSREIVLGSVGSFAAVLKDGKWKTIDGNAGLRDDWINDAVSTNDGIWLAGSKGLFLLKEDKVAKWKTPRVFCCVPNGWSNPEVNVVLPFGSALFIGTAQDGIFRIDADGTENKIWGTSGNVQALAFWKDRLWGAGPGALWSIDHKQSGKLTAQAVSGPWEKTCHFKSMVVSPNDHLLIGTFDGRIYETSDGENFAQIIEYSGKAFRKK